MSISKVPDVAKKITRLYLLALSAIAILSVGGQILVQKSLSNQLSDSMVINIAGRQRMLSQRICKTALLLIDKKDTVNNSTFILELNDALRNWEKFHEGLKNGYLDTLDVAVKNSDTIMYMFRKIEPYYQEMHSNANSIYRYFDKSELLNKNQIDDKMHELLKNERGYLNSMDNIVFQYQLEAKQRVNDSKNIEIILLFCTLLVLLLEGLFVFKPAVKQIKETIEKLFLSEQKTHKINEELIVVNKSLQETREALLEANNQKHLREINRQKLRSAYLIEGQEEERKRIAREIHDGLGQMLTALKFGIEKLSDNVNGSDAGKKNLSELQGMVTQTIAEARTISFNLMPTVLSDFGVSSALKLLSSQAGSQTGIHITFDSNMKSERLPKNVEVGLYRIGQEAIHNAVKYSSAKEIKIELSRKKKYIHFNISDNGQGFSYEEVMGGSEERGPGLGINNMKERAFMINGDIKIYAYPGKGTEIRLKIPINEHELYE